MDPDAALRLALDPTTPPAEAQEARRGLRRWLLLGGFPPAERIAREAGITRRRALGHRDDHSRLYVLPYEDGWAILLPGRPDTETVMTMIFRLRREKEG